MKEIDIIKKNWGVYKRAAEEMTEWRWLLIYYVDYNESDENASVIIKDLNWKVISDNNFASDSFFELMKNKSYVWASDEAKENAEAYFKEYGYE